MRAPLLQQLINISIKRGMVEINIKQSQLQMRNSVTFGKISRNRESRSQTKEWATKKTTPKRHLVVTSLRIGKNHARFWLKTWHKLPKDNNSERQVHPSTIRRAFIRNCLHGRVAQKTPLNKKNKTKRLKYA